MTERRAWEDFGLLLVAVVIVLWLFLHALAEWAWLGVSGTCSRAWMGWK